MSIQLAIVILYIILLFAISMYVKHRASQNPTEYLFAGRKFSTGLVAVSITGMAVGAASTVGVAESAVKVGLAAGWYNAAWAIGAIVMGFVAAGKYRSLNCTTIPELFERSYDKKPASSASSACLSSCSASRPCSTSPAAPSCTPSCRISFPCRAA